MTAGRLPSTLYRNGRVRTPASPFATALLVVGSEVAWVGTDEAAAGITADRVVDLADALLAPAFVDAHVHTTATGLALGGLDLTSAPSLAAALDAVAAAGGTGVLLGTGWDETSWPERRPPTAAELDRAAGGRPVYLARTDVHAAVASSALLATARPQGLPGYAGDGLCRLEAHHAVRAAAYASVGPDQRRVAQRRTRSAAAALGIAALHEMAGPDISSLDDLRALLELAAAEPGPEVAPYWSGDVATAAGLGAGFGGDLFVDGTVGSRTAAFSAPYTDGHHTDGTGGDCGTLRIDAADLAEALVECGRRGVQAGFHVIGDAAVAAALDALEAAPTSCGGAAGGTGHRLEHVETAGIGAAAGAAARMAALGVVASVQPAFDARWGGPDGMYATRLGADRAAGMNDFAALAAAGVVLALSSDAPVTPLDPWGGVRAAVRPHVAGHGLSARAAFSAATRGGWRAARRDGDGSGELAPGHPATFAVWAVPGELVAQAPHGRAAARSTDPGVAVAGLPDLDASDPFCLLTVVRGTVVHDAGALAR